MAEEKLRVIGYTKHPKGPKDPLWEMDCRQDADDAVHEDLVSNKYVFSGDYHQYGMNGVPVLSDGTLYMCSMRSWGSVMYTAVYDKPDRGAGYCEFAWGIWGSAKEKHPPKARHIKHADVVKLFAKNQPERYEKILNPDPPLTPEQIAEIRKQAEEDYRKNYDPEHPSAVTTWVRGMMNTDSFAFSILPPDYKPSYKKGKKHDSEKH